MPKGKRNEPDKRQIRYVNAWNSYYKFLDYEIQRPGLTTQERNILKKCILKFAELEEKNIVKEQN